MDRKLFIKAICRQLWTEPFELKVYDDRVGPGAELRAVAGYSCRFLFYHVFKCCGGIVDRPRRSLCAGYDKELDRPGRISCPGDLHILDLIVAPECQG